MPNLLSSSFQSFQVSFMVDPDVIPGRMTLLVTLFLVLTNIFNKIPETSPKVTAFSALTAWVLSCILFVFGALCGYAGILLRKMISLRVCKRLCNVDYRKTFFNDLK